jgi:hypothetical protein
MSLDMETILRKSLDEVDRVQKWQVTGIVIFLILLLLHVFAFIGMVHGGSETAALTRRIVGMGIMSVIFTVAVCTFGITFFISRMTKRILKAIEVSSKS